MPHIAIVRGPAGRLPGTLPRPEQAYAAIEAAFAEWVAAQTPAFLEALNDNPQVQESGGIEDPTVSRQIDLARVPGDKLLLVKRSLLYGILPELSFKMDEAGTLAMVVSGNDRAEFEARVSFEVVVPLPEVNPAQRDVLQKSFAYQVVSQLNKLAASNAQEFREKMNGRVPLAVFVNGVSWAMAAWGDEALVKFGLRVSEDAALTWLGTGEKGYVVRGVNAPIPRSLMPGLPEDFLPEQPLLIEVLSGAGERGAEEVSQGIVAELKKRLTTNLGLGLLAQSFGIARPGILQLVQSELAKLTEDLAFNATTQRAAGERALGPPGKVQPAPFGRKQSAEDKARLKQRIEKVRSLIRTINGMAEKPVTKDQMAQVVHVILTLTELGKTDKALAYLHEHMKDFRGDALLQELQELADLLKT